MTAGRRRSPGATAVTKDAIENAADFLKDLPEKPKDSWSLREAIEQLQDSIKAALDRGYTHEEVSEMLTQKGIRISPSSLKSYLAATSRNRAAGDSPKRKRSIRSKAEALTPAESDDLTLSTADPADADEVATDSKRTTRSAASSKTKSVAKPKTTTARSAAKKTTATSSTRGRGKRAMS